jgi:hypothetical protein
LVRRYIDKRGKPKIVGLKALKQAASYPPAMASAIAAAMGECRPQWESAADAARRQAVQEWRAVPDGCMHRFI